MVKVVGQDNKVSVEAYAGKALIDPAIVLVGKDGKDGKDGITGPEGMPGRDGVDGVDGKDGKDGRDGIDGKDGISYWIEYDKKTNALVFKNDGGKKNPDPVKLAPLAKGWGYGAGRGGGQVQADWNQTDKNNPTYIKNKPTVHNIRFLVVEELPVVGDPCTVYLIQEEENQRGGSGGNIYSEWVFVENDITHTLSWEKLGTDVDLSGYATETWVGQQGFLTSTALSNYVTTNTTQTITEQKTFKRTETQFQDSVARFVSTYISSTQGWRGRVVIGAKDYTFIIGTYNGMAAIGGHKFTDSSTESGATWSDIYFQPDGDKAIYFGGWNWTQNSGWFKVQNNASNTGGKVQVNTGSIASANWKDVAYKGENVKDFSFTSISGYNASKTQTLKHINGTLTWVDD